MYTLFCFVFCLVFLSLLVRPAHAQGPPANYYQLQPCDAKGNLLSYPSSGPNGYTMTSTLTGQTTNTYPVAMVNAAVSNPTLYGYLLNCVAPLGISPVPYTSASSFGNGNVSAYNGFANAAQNLFGYYNVPAQYAGPKDTPVNGYVSGPINGSVTIDLSGQLVYYFKATWLGTGTPPGYIDLLLTTNVYAYANVNYLKSVQQSGLSAQAKATDGSPFNETAAVSATSTAPSANTFTVTGHHLVRASVDLTTGIAEVYLNSTAHSQADNEVPLYTLTSPTQVNGITGTAAQANVVASVEPDSRDVRIFGQIGTTYRKGPAGAPVANGADANGTETDDTLAPAPNSSLVINPIGWASGPWGANSKYQWSVIEKAPMMNLSTGTGSSGIVSSSGTIPGQPVTYYRPVPFSGPITSNHHLVVTDGVDGASEAADYFINFHAEYENLNKVTDVKVVGATKQVSGSFLSGPSGGTFPLPVTGTVSVTVSIAPASAASVLAAAYNVTGNGATYTSPAPHNAPLPMPASKYCWIVSQPYFEQLTGTADNYEASGYQSMISWTIQKAYHSGNPLVDYVESLASSNSPPPTN